MAKRVKVSRKEFLKEQDQFLSVSQKVTAYMSDHGPLMLTTAGVVIVLFALIAGYRYNQQMKDMRMESLYSEMTKIHNAKADQKSENTTGELENFKRVHKKPGPLYCLERNIIRTSNLTKP